MCECLDYDDGTRHTCEACVGDLEMFRDALARSESARGEAEETSADLERRLGELLDRLTNGLYSKTGYSVDQMEQMVDEAYQKLYESALASERAAREAAEARVAELEQHRTKLDCRFVGRYAEMSGSHCPSGEPCQRCELERAREAAEAERDEARASVGRCHTLIDGLWAITDPEKHADIVASVDAELAPCDRHFAENEALRSSLTRAVEALREIAVGLLGEDMEHGESFKWALCCARLTKIARAALAGQEVGR